MVIQRTFRLVLVGALAALGCGGGADTPADSGAGNLDATTGAQCAAEPKVQAYSAGVSAHSEDGAVTIRILDAEPAPPEKGTNRWTIEVTDASGAPIDGATIGAKPFMPAHGHGSSIVPKVSPGDAPGRYTVDLLNLFMPGVWRITFDVETPAADEAVELWFCIEG